MSLNSVIILLKNNLKTILFYLFFCCLRKHLVYNTQI